MSKRKEQHAGRASAVRASTPTGQGARVSDEARLAAPEAQQLAIEDLRDAWRLLDSSERVEGFRLLGLVDGEEFFIALPTTDQRELLNQFTPIERRHWVRMVGARRCRRLAPRGRRGAPQRVDGAVRRAVARREVAALLAYSEDAAGGLMSPRFARVRPEQTVDEAILYLRRQAFDRLELIYYGYVLDREQRLLGEASFRDLFRARGSAYVRDVMKTDVASVPEEMDQESVGRLFAEQDLVALPVVDSSGRMKGIVTVDDIVDVVEEEATRRSVDRWPSMRRISRSDCSACSRSAWAG